METLPGTSASGSGHPAKVGQAASVAASRPTPRPRTCGYLLGPSRAVGNADASRFPAVASSRLCADGLTFVRGQTYTSMEVDTLWIVFSQWTRPENC
jgi:hypothetical protein